MARETPEQKARREQRELMERLNAERDKKMTTRQQNDMRTRGAPGRPAAPAVPQVRSTTDRAPMGGAAGRARDALERRGREQERQIEALEKPRGGGRGRR